jgi:hypothetical protein
MTSKEKVRQMHLAYVDESGAPSPADGNRYLAVAVLVPLTPRVIELHVRRARRSLRRRTPSGEPKAAQSNPVVVRTLLEAIAGEPCGICAVIVDKRGVEERQAEIVYQPAVARAIAHATQRHSHLHVYRDKRYTKLEQRLALEQRIREAIAHIPDQVVIIEQADSTGYPGLQAVDFVAWAIRRKHEGIGDSRPDRGRRADSGQENSGSAWGPMTTVSEDGVGYSTNTQPHQDLRYRSGHIQPYLEPAVK